MVCASASAAALGWAAAGAVRQLEARSGRQEEAGGGRSHGRMDEQEDGCRDAPAARRQSVRRSVSQSV